MEKCFDCGNDGAYRKCPDGEIDQRVSCNSRNSGSAPSYHDLHITTEAIPRTAISNLPFGLEVSCNRVGGWSLWSEQNDQLAGEYGDNWLVLDVNGMTVVDSRPNANSAERSEDSNLS